MMLVNRNNQPAFNSLMDEFFKNDRNDQLDRSYKSEKPKTNISETETAYHIEMLVPGFDKKDLAINIEDNLLTVSVEREDAKEEAKKVFFKEFDIKEFKRSFKLSYKVDKDNIQAQFNNGILSISVPKKEEAIIKKMIEIK